MSGTDFMEIHIEEAIGCDGFICNRSPCEETGEAVDLPPHYHMIVTGNLLDAVPRCYAIGGDLPDSAGEPDQD
jgi:hypothetical protein